MASAMSIDEESGSSLRQNGGAISISERANATPFAQPTKHSTETLRRIRWDSSRTAGTGRRGWQKGRRNLLRPRPGFYVLRLRRGASLVPTLIDQLCPRVIPRPNLATARIRKTGVVPWTASRLGAQIDGKAVAAAPRRLRGTPLWAVTASRT